MEEVLYYKVINDRVVRSYCRALYIAEERRWVSNPSQELIFAQGWRIWTPPVVPVEPMTEPYEQDILEAVKRMLASSVNEMSDEDALDVAALFPTWASKIGQQVVAGERLWYDAKLYKVVQPHTPQQEWTPDITPALYTEVSIEEWPEFVQPTGAHDAYNTGDKVTFEGKHYICQMDNCVWNPDQYPAAWKLV